MDVLWTLILSAAKPTDQGEESVVLVVVGGEGLFFSFSCTFFGGVKRQKLCLKMGAKRQKLCLKRGVKKQTKFLKGGVKRQKLCFKRGVKRQKLLSPKGCEKAKLFISWCID